MEYTGKAVSPGIAVGSVYLYDPRIPVPEERAIPAAQRADALERYNNAQKAAMAELDGIRERLAGQGEGDKAKIFAAQIDLLRDITIEKEIRDGIGERFWDVEWAIYSVFGKYIEILDKISDPLFRERVDDLKDVRNRLLRCCRGLPEKGLSNLTKPVVVVCRDLLPTDTAGMNRENVLAIVAETGGETSHSAILARSYGIPAVLGVAGVTQAVASGETVIVDAVRGTVLIRPDDGLCAAYRGKCAAFRKAREETDIYLKRPPLMADGTKLDIHLNLSSSEPTELEWADCVDGVGLLRTEFLYMQREAMPSEEEQFQIYKKVLLAFGPRPVILRTLDIGGDKTLPYLPLAREENPFLGERAIRLCLNRPELFTPQLRAVLRASVFGNLWIMFPMIGGLKEFRGAKAALEEVRLELVDEGVPVSDSIKTGIMIEIPSAALMADRIAAEVDFASIGSNDLIQYTLAVDRMNPAVSDYYQTYHPAVLRLIRHAAEAFDRAGKPICLCGEMGGMPQAAVLLAGMGLRKLSMNATSIAPVKKALAGISAERARELAAQACGLATSEEVIQLLGVENLV